MGIKPDQMKKVILDFLRTGRAGGLDAATLSQECDRVIRLETEVSSQSAVKLGRSFVRLAVKDRTLSLSTAYRALGWALLVAGRYDEAEKTYLDARALLKRQALDRARIDRVLVDVYMYIGDLKRARRHARMAMTTFRKHGAEADLAKTSVNYANLLHRQDRHRQAEELYREAGAYFHSQGHDLAVAFCQYNQANTLVQLFEFDRAGKLYERAEKTFLRHGHNLRANGCRYGLAWLHMLEGNYHIALQELAQCEKEYREASQPREVILCQLDRAEAYLGLNLYSDAVGAAREAETGARRLGIHYELAKATFFKAKASAALGRRRQASQALNRAAESFQREQNEPFLAATEFLSAQIENDEKIRIDRMLAARRRFTRAQLPLWEAVCDLQYLTERPDETAAVKRLSANPAVRAVPHLYARQQTMLGDRAARQGRSETARKHWTRAAEMLDAVRAKLPPVDMRSTFTRHRSDPYLKLVRSSLKENTLDAAAWSERFRTAGLWAVPDEMLPTSPERIRAEKSLAELAHRVTVLSGRLSGPEGQRAEVAVQPANSLRKLQRQVRLDLAALEKSRQAATQSLDDLRTQLRAASYRQPIVQFHTDRSDLVAFVHHRGDTRYHRYRDGVGIAHEQMGRWRFLVERAVYANGRPGEVDIADESRLLRQIGDWLWAPLEIPAGRRRVMIIPDGYVADLPWQALFVGGGPLAVRHEFIFAPSIRHHLHARSQHNRSRRIEVFVGAADDLPRTAEDYTVLEERAGKDVTVHRPCRRADWPDNSRARIWHYVGHAQLRRDNPFYSSLTLSDGPLFAADLRLKRNSIGLATLAACRTGQQAYLPGEESTGLVRSFLEMGARNVVASQWAVSDRSTALWMKKFYARYLSGEGVASAVRNTTLELSEDYPAAYNWAAFSAYGAG